MLSKYDEFILEKQFDDIISDIFKIVENGQWVGDREFEWDLTQPEKKETLVDKTLAKLKSFIPKLNKEQLRNYYIKLVNKLKSLPDRLRRFLLTHYTSAFLSAASLTYLISGGVAEEPKPLNTDKAKAKVEQIDQKIKKEIEELHRVASFEAAQSLVKEVEAGYSDDRGDTGNWIRIPGGGRRFIGTNHGISAPVLQDYLGRLPKKEDMQNLSYETALEIYKKDYWDAQNLGSLCDQSVANIIYDGCVNQGTTAISEVIIKAAADQKVTINGSPYSKENIKTLNTLNQSKLFNSIKKYREMRYKEARTWKRHGEGWLNRLSSIAYDSNNDKA